MHKSEKEVIAGILGRDDKVLREFYDSHHEAVYRFIFRQLGKQDLAEELTQDVFLDFIEGLRDFRGEAKLKTYLFTIARYKVADAIKKKKLKRILFSALPRYVVENIMGVFVDDEVERRDLSQRIERVIDSLPNDYRIIIRLKYVDGVRVKDIARQMAISFKATESLLFRARKAFIKAFRTA